MWVDMEDRCATIYDKQGIEVVKVIRSISFLVEEWSNSCIKNMEPVVKDKPGWRKPVEGCVKINCDASFKLSELMCKV